MKPQPDNLISQPGRSRRMRGFTLVELMVTVALLSVIILGLVAMFNQTRRAFTSSLTQVDVLESGRAAADLIARDLEQMAPCYCFSPSANPIYNFYSATFNYPVNLVQQLADPADQWTNMIDELLFLTRNNQQWTAIGYRLQPADETAGVGTLYRYSVPNVSVTNGSINQYLAYAGITLTTNFNRIIDGVTHFRVRAYDRNGTWYTNASRTNNCRIDLPTRPGVDYTYGFSSNAVPAYVEIELGIMETRALERYRSIGPGTAAQNYLINHAGQVHLFRQRIPIRSVDPAAFP